jgi:hypothetical protein
MNEELKRNKFSSEELSRIKSIFGGENGKENIKLLRKMFAPEYDYNLPIGRQQEVIMWQNLDQMVSMAPADREIAILSQIKLSRHLEAQLQTILFLANQEEETLEDVAKRMSKNSTQ